MLQLLHIRDFVIVDEAHIEFNDGFSVFSGETGAGKSILIDALSLALGARAEQGFIRQGATRAEINAVFHAPATAQAWLQEQGIEQEESIILRRVIDHNNRSRAFINGTPSPLNQVRDLAALLVDIHGQHAHQSLLNHHTHAHILDAQGQHQTLARSTRQAWQNWQKLRRALDEAQAQQEQAHEQLEQLSWQIEQLETLNLAPNEWTQLTQEHERLAHAHTILEELAEAKSLLDDEQSGQSTRRLLHQAHQHVQTVLRHDERLLNIVQNLASAQIACDEAISELNSYLSAIEIDPMRLSELDQRMAQAFELARRFHCDPEALTDKYQELLELQAQLHERLDLDKLLKQCHAAQQEFEQLAQKLTAARQKIAKKLGQQVTQTMQELAMEGGQFAVQLTPCAPHAGGHEQVEFLVAGHAGARPAPLAKVASGGELARISLALVVIAHAAEQVPTLIFDEVDTGIGGAVAEIVGRLLAQLGKRHQVLCVTHLAQVAANAQHHYQVSKKQVGKQTLSAIQALDPKQRVDELARMLGGIEITTTTRQHAQELLERAP